MERSTGIFPPIRRSVRSTPDSRPAHGRIAGIARASQRWSSPAIGRWSSRNSPGTSRAIGTPLPGTALSTAPDLRNRTSARPRLRSDRRRHHRRARYRGRARVLRRARGGPCHRRFPAARSPCRWADRSRDARADDPTRWNLVVFLERCVIRSIARSQRVDAAENLRARHDSTDQWPLFGGTGRRGRTIVLVG